MDLPAGIHQDTACFILAMRDFYEDPAWTDPQVTAIMRQCQHKAASTGDSTLAGMPHKETLEVLARLGFRTIKTAYSVRGNPDGHLALFDDNREGYIERRTKCLLSFKTSRTTWHIICGPYNIVRDLMGQVEWRMAAIHASDIQEV